MIVFYRNGNSQKWQVSGNGKRFDGFSGEEDSSPAIVGLRNGLDKVGIVKVCLNYFEISWKLMTTITICHYHHDNHHHLSLSSSQPPPLSLSSSQRPPSVTIIITTTTIVTNKNWGRNRSFREKGQKRKHEEKHAYLVEYFQTLSNCS